MRIQPDYLRDYLLAAAVEQTAQELTRQGYEVEREGRLGSAVVDLRAERPGGREELYLFLVAGVGDEGWSERAARVRAEARARGAGFHVVPVWPPHDVDVEIVGLEQTLKAALRDHPPDSLREFGSNAEVEDVTAVEVSLARVDRGSIHVAGSALATVGIPSGDGMETGVDTCPVRFDVVLSERGEMRAVNALDLDTSA